MAEPNIDSLDERLQRARQDTARDKELAAVQTELHAEMWRDAVSENQNVAQHAHEQLRNYEKQASKARDEAKKMHAIAGTAPENFAVYVRRAYEETLDTFKQEYVKSKDAEAHPEAYGEFIVPSAVYAAGIAVAEKGVAGLDNQTTTKKAAK